MINLPNIFKNYLSHGGGEESFETKGLVGSMTFMKTGDIFYPFNMRSNQRYLQINKVRLKNNEIDQVSR